MLKSWLWADHSTLCMFTGLNREQVDTLWRCLAQNPACSDDCLSWFLNQAKSKDHHALGVETFRHIFLEKVGPGSDWSVGVPMKA